MHEELPLATIQNAVLEFLRGRDDVELSAASTLGEEALAAVQAKVDISFGTQDYHDLLKLDLDVVVIASPHLAHYQQAHDASNKLMVFQEPGCRG